MDTSEPVSAAEEEEEKVTEQRPRTRSNPEGAEDRALSKQASVGNRSEGEGEAASADDSPQSAATPNGKDWQVPAQPTEFQVKTPRVNCPEKVIICLDLSEEMSLPKLESFNGSKTNALNISQKMIEMFVRTKHKIDKCHEFALVVVNNDATWLSGFTSDPREVCSCLYDLETVVCKSFNLEGLFNLMSWLMEMFFQSAPFACSSSCPMAMPVMADMLAPLLACGPVILRKGRWQTFEEMYTFFSNLDTKGTNYKYEVSVTGPAVELHNCMAKLLAHPLQRPFQTHASYSLLEEEEPAEIEATV
nr:BRISC and BRCA1-A complex member 1-like [Chelonoidis abingdonii]